MKTSHLCLVVLPMTFPCSAAQSLKSSESSESAISYSTVAEAMTALHANPKIKFNVSKDGWTKASEESSNVVWAFAPASDPAYPAVTKRVIYGCNVATHIDMGVLCEAGEKACTQFVENAKVSNARFIKGLEKFYEQNPETNPCRAPNNAQPGVHANVHEKP